MKMVNVGLYICFGSVLACTVRTYVSSTNLYTISYPLLDFKLFLFYGLLLTASAFIEFAFQ